MKRYFFILKTPDEMQDDLLGTPLPNDAAARSYAQRIIRELKEAGGYDDPDFEMIVRNEKRQTLFAIPFAEIIPTDGERQGRPLN